MTKINACIVGKRHLKKYDYYSHLIAIAHYRLKNKVDDLHHTLSRRLVHNNETIVLGKLEVSNLTRKKDDLPWLEPMRNKMRMWGHYFEGKTGFSVRSVIMRLIEM